jgi:hypothetical protein
VAREDDPLDEWDDQGDQSTLSWVRTLMLPLAVLVVFVAIVSGLVLGGVVQGHESRVGPDHAPTTRPTVEIAP